MSTDNGFELKNPLHPGQFIMLQVFEPRGLSVTGAAEALGVSRRALSLVVNARARVSPELALRLEKAFALPMDFMLRVQAGYDVAQIRMRQNSIKVERFKDEAAPEF